uniref:Uncharacterized protein n=1 Tax=Utricularia reniformis TaxID=192314 RepID=A0A1Y0B2N3_9LAMI|nr:hypothetical protein AEK19_MT1415 [Utricularia reniformis]ART31609.1 hypothetical protein AEK19_MT1415 [Utricularia reniformis]
MMNTDCNCHQTIKAYNIFSFEGVFSLLYHAGLTTIGAL